MISETKTRQASCRVCGGELSPTADWGPDWLASWYCSQPCSERRLLPLDYRLQDVILKLLDQRSRGSTLRLEELARFVDPLGWESLIERSRNAAGRLVAKGELLMERPEIVDGSILDSHDVLLRLPD